VNLQIIAGAILNLKYNSMSNKTISKFYNVAVPSFIGFNNYKGVNIRIALHQNFYSSCVALRTNENNNNLKNACLSEGGVVDP